MERRSSRPGPAGLLLAVCGLVSCTGSPRITLEGFDEIDAVAVLGVGADGQLRAGSPVRRLQPGQGVEVFGPADTDLIVVGWRDGELGPDEPPAEGAIAPIPPGPGCVPRLVTPAVAARVGPDSALRLEPNTLPPLTAPWAANACPANAVDRLSFDALCAESPCAPAIIRSGRCTFTARLDCIGLTLDGTIDAAGRGCLASTGAGGEAVCSPADAPPALAARARCPGSTACPVDLFQSPSRPLLAVDRVVVRDVPRYVPPSFLVGDPPVVRVAGKLVGWGFDFDVLGDRVVVATPADEARYLCASGDVRTQLHAFALDSLAPIATRIGPSCLTLLTSTGTSALAVWVEGSRYRLGVLGPDLQTSQSVDLDPRELRAPGQPPLTRSSSCAHPIELLLDGPRVYVIIERPRICADRGTTVHVLDRATLAPLALLDAPNVDTFGAIIADGALWWSNVDSLAVERRPLQALATPEAFEAYPSVSFADRDVLSIGFDVDRDELILGVGQRLPMLNRLRTAGRATEIARFRAPPYDPVAIWPRPFAGARGLVVGLRSDGAGGWPATAALYDRDDFVVLPGEVPLGYGPPRRVRSDGRGGLLALMMWEGTLVRIRPAP